MTDRSSLAGKTLEDLDLRHSSGASIVAVERNRNFSREVLRPTAKMELRADDILLIDLFAPHGSIEMLRQQFALEALPLSGAYFTDRSQEIGMAEVILPADFGSRRQDGARDRVPDPIRIDRGRSAARPRRARGQPAERGAATWATRCLLIGPWKDIKKLRSDSRDLVIIKLPAELDEVLPAPGKAPQAWSAWRSSSG